MVYYVLNQNHSLKKRKNSYHKVKYTLIYLNTLLSKQASSFSHLSHHPTQSCHVQKFVLSAATVHFNGTMPVTVAARFACPYSLKPPAVQPSNNIVINTTRFSSVEPHALLGISEKHKQQIGAELLMLCSLCHYPRNNGIPENAV
jgi:hypothetical protein